MWSKRKLKIEFSRQLRKGQTETEEALWWLLRDRRMLGYKFRRQHIINGFVVDFYCPAARLGIELDGSVHLKQKDYDKLRQQVIEEKGVRMLRFTNAEVKKEPVKVLETIIQNLPLAALSTEWRGGTTSEASGG